MSSNITQDQVVDYIKNNEAALMNAIQEAMGVSCYHNTMLGFLVAAEQLMEWYGEESIFPSYHKDHKQSLHLQQEADNYYRMEDNEYTDADGNTIPF